MAQGRGVSGSDGGFSGRSLKLLETGIFRVMLTDIKMPGMDGVILLTRAKEIQPDLAVVMMTAYAAVDTAVEAMKQGALDYLVKPFDPDAVLQMVDRIYMDAVAKNARKEIVDAVIVATGATFFQPDRGINPYGYGRISGVVTNLEFERMLSHAGPGGMDLKHPVTGRPVTRIAWFQCVGSRDIQTGTPFCSAICCMVSVKQSLLAKTMYPQVTEACVFYMDLRTWGKASDAYTRQAETAGVRFVRARVHSLAPGLRKEDDTIQVSWLDLPGNGKNRRSTWLSWRRDSTRMRFWPGLPKIMNWPWTIGGLSGRNSFCPRTPAARVSLPAAVPRDPKTFTIP